MRTLATTRRVLTQIGHDKRTLGLLLVVPSLLIGLMAWLFDDTDTFQAIGPAVLGLFPFIIMFLVTSIATLRELRAGGLRHRPTSRQPRLPSACCSGPPPAKR